VFGVQADKDIAGMASMLGDLAQEVFLCDLPAPRGARAADLMAAFGAERSTCWGSPAAGRRAAESRAQTMDGPVRIIIAGSFITVGDCGLG
ncbi:MAG: hypothetical protein ABF296_06420, partial [Oceanococcaceae bacterium]